MSDSNLFVGTWKLVSWEFTGTLPERTDPASQNHMTILRGIAMEAKLLLGRKGSS